MTATAYATRVNGWLTMFHDASRNFRNLPSNPGVLISHSQTTCAFQPSARSAARCRTSRSRLRPIFADQYSAVACGCRAPRANAEYWSAKIGRNRDRDVRHLAALRADGWKAHVVWECEIRTPGLLGRLRKFLDAS